MNLKLFIPDRKKFARLFYGLSIVFFVLRIREHVLLSQLETPVLTLMNLDITYLTFLLSGVSRFLTGNHTVSVLFDVSLVTSAIVSFIFARQRVSSIVFTVLLGIYVVTGYTFLCFHKHNLVGLWVCSLMFLAIDDTGFNLLYRLTRYYCLFTYASAGFWKFFRGVWNAPGHLPVIIKSDALEYLVEHPGSILSAVISWLIIHPALLDGIMLITCCMQLLFIIGFFTRRMDGFFFVYALTFHLFSLLFLQANFMEFSVILITLLPLRVLYKTPAKAETTKGLVGN